MKHLEKNLSKVQKIHETKGIYDALIATCDIGVLYYLNIFQYKKAEVPADLMQEKWNTIAAKTVNSKLIWYCHSNAALYWITANQIQLLVRNREKYLRG